MSYQPNIPTGTVDLDIDYQNLQENFSQLDTQFGVDHVPFSDNSGIINGYHEDIHFNPVSTTTTNPPNNYPIVAGVNAPSATPGFGQIFCPEVNDGQNTDNSLYFLSGGNRLTQLTRNIQPSIASPGYTYLPGGLILQWGTATMNTLTNFPIAFSTTFTPVLTYGVSSGGAVPIIGTLTNTQFRISGAAGTATWMAIGF